MERSSITARLAYLKALDTKLEYFGAISHRYKLNRPATEEQVASVEASRHVVLPVEYRNFITSIGNGGAGPYCGLYPLGYEHDPHALAEWDDRFLGDLSQPFPHREAWNLPPEFWAEEPDPPPDIPVEEEDSLMEAWDARLGVQYWRRDVVNGAIPIADIGCSLGVILVVTGPEAGTVWEDLRADYRGIRPAVDASGRRLNFSAWYLNWLNAGISKFGGDPDLVPPASRSWWRRIVGG